VVIDSKGVLYCSARGSSGYAESGRRVIYELLKQNLPLSWHQFIPDDTKDDETDPIYQSIKKNIDKNIDFDTAIFHCTPDCWFDYIEKYKIKLIGKKLIGYLTWETNKISDLWVKYINLMNEVWVPCKFNKEVLEKCGVNVPIKIIPYPFIEQPLVEINADSLTSLLMQSKWYGNEAKLFRYGADWKIFYVIGEWNDRKNIEDTVKTFCKAFTVEDRVKLIIKTFHLDYSKKNTNYCIIKLEELLREYKNHPEILLITENISHRDILFLHSIGDCFFSMTRGEGFCLGAFDAFNYGKDVVITGFGGQLDYLGKDYTGLVGYDLINVDFKERDSLYSSDQRWADPNINDGMDRLKECYLKNDPLPEWCPITLNKGWYFKEQKNTKYYRQAAPQSNIIFNNSAYSYIRLKLRYDFGESTKNIEITTDNSLKKTILLNKGVSQTISIPSFGVKNLEFNTDYSTPEKHNNALWDHRNVGFVLEEVSLIEGSNIELLSIDKILVDNELTDFYFLSQEQKIAEEIKQDIALLGNVKQKINLVKIEVKSDSEFQGITYIGQYGTCGYATAAKGNLCHFFTKGIPITWIPIYMDNSTLSDECFYNAMVKSLINKQINYYDTVIMHLTADCWPEHKEHYNTIIKGKKLIGYTVWETSRLPYLWVENINECVDEVWCPSTYNEMVFKHSGVKVPIKVFPHIFLQKELPSKELVSLKSYNNINLAKESKYYTFYNISELNPRKGVEDLVRVFCDAFTSKDKVRLVLKVHYKNYEDQNKKYCINLLNDIASEYKNPPRIYYILNNLSEKEILGLHALGDCYVSLCKSEGFGLTIFEAYKYGKHVITTGYGGQVDFLGKDYEGLVQYKLGLVTKMKEFSKYYSDDQEWAYPVLDHARDLMMLATK